MRRLLRLILAIMLAMLPLGLSGCGSDNPVWPEFSASPDQVQFIATDIVNFWRAYDLAFAETSKEQRLAIFEREYFNRGSVGLRDFMRLQKIPSIPYFVARVEQCRAYYESVRANTVHYTDDTVLAPVRQSFVNLQRLYPEATFPDVYFTIGSLGVGGTATEHGLILGIEIYAKADDSPLDTIEDWFRPFLRSPEFLPGLVAHELIHTQQRYDHAAILLTHAILEGNADFLGEMISGQNINANLHIYGNPREAELWQAFQTVMHGTNFTDWLYGAGTTNRPPNLGYYLGYKICEAYYARSADKAQAIRDMLTVQDGGVFLRASHYEDKFNQ